MYARIFAVHGSTVDRRTNNYTTRQGLERAIRNEVKRMRNSGPYVIERYIAGVRRSDFDY